MRFRRFLPIRLSVSNLRTTRWNGLFAHASQSKLTPVIVARGASCSRPALSSRNANAIAVRPAVSRYELFRDAARRGKSAGIARTRRGAAGVSERATGVTRILSWCTCANNLVRSRLASAARASERERRRETIWIIYWLACYYFINRGSFCRMDFRRFHREISCLVVASRL